MDWRLKDDIRNLDDECYPLANVGWTHAQMTTLFRKWKRSDNGMLWKDFARSAESGGFGCLVVKWCGMWLCIEPDGHSHT